MSFDPVESVYPPVMEEIARRIVAAELSLQDVRRHAGDPNIWIGCEIAVLQIRKICEFILLGSTVVHSQEGNISLNLKEWRPKSAFIQLDKVSDHPLQMPVTVELNGKGQGQHHIVPKTQPIKFEAISRIYGICGDLLHAPTAHQILRQALPSYDVELLERWVKGFKAVAMSHVLILPTKELVMLCQWTGLASDLPQMFLMGGNGESTMDLSSYPPFDLLP